MRKLRLRSVLGLVLLAGLGVLIAFAVSNWSNVQADLNEEANWKTRSVEREIATVLVTAHRSTFALVLVANSIEQLSPELHTFLDTVISSRQASFATISRLKQHYDAEAKARYSSPQAHQTTYTSTLSGKVQWAGITWTLTDIPKFDPFPPLLHLTADLDLNAPNLEQRVLFALLRRFNDEYAYLKAAESNVQDPLLHGTITTLLAASAAERDWVLAKIGDAVVEPLTITLPGEGEALNPACLVGSLNWQTDGVLSSGIYAFDSLIVAIPDVTAAHSAAEEVIAQFPPFIQTSAAADLLRGLMQTDAWVTNLKDYNQSWKSFFPPPHIEGNTRYYVTYEIAVNFAPDIWMYPEAKLHFEDVTSISTQTTTITKDGTEETTTKTDTITYPAPYLLTLGRTDLHVTLTVKWYSHEERFLLGAATSATTEATYTFTLPRMVVAFYYEDLCLN